MASELTSVVERANVNKVERLAYSNFRFSVAQLAGGVRFPRVRFSARNLST